MQILRLQLHVTERCNWRCRHCYQGDNFIKEKMRLSDIVQVIKDFIKLGDELSVPFPLIAVAFSGGEPFVRKDFMQLLEQVKIYKNRVVFSILTNGSFLSAEIIRKLKNDIGIRSIQLSIEGHRKINDEIRGKGSYDLVKEKIKLLNNFKINTQLSLTINKKNILDIPKIFSDFSNYQVRFNIRRLVPMGRGRKMKALMLSPVEIRNLYSFLEKKREKFNIYRACDEVIFNPFVKDESKLIHCGLFHKSSLAVVPNGDVYPCRRLPIKIGNVLQNRLNEIYFKSEIFNILSSGRKKLLECLNCNFFEKCEGGARCIAYAYFDNQRFNNPDPQCSILFKKLPNSSANQQK